METEADSEIMKEEVAALIFDMCDSEKNGVVQSSSLIEQIRTYFNEISELDVLRNMLDPKGIDVAITRDSFSENFKLWIHRQNQNDLDSSANSSKSPKNSQRKSVSPLAHDLNSSEPLLRESAPKRALKQQVPQKKIRQQLQFCTPYKKREGYSGDFLDVSNDSIISSNNNDATIESLEEKINDYHYENVKFSVEITELQLQLAISEETNTKLQKDLDQALHKLQLKQQHYDEIQKNVDALREAGNNKKQEIEKLEAYTVKLRKENKKLSDKVNEITSEKQNLTECFEETRGKVVELSKKLVTARDLEKELNITLAEHRTALEDITAKYKELEQKIEDYVNIIEHLQNENKMLQDDKNYYSFEDIYKDINEFSPIIEENTSISEDLTHFDSIREKIHKMYPMLQNPLSPIAEISNGSLVFSSTPDFNKRMKSSIISMTSARKDGQYLPVADNSLTSLNLLISPHNHTNSRTEVVETRNVTDETRNITSQHNHTYSLTEVDKAINIIDEARNIIDTRAGSTQAKESNFQTCQELSTELAEISNQVQYSRLPNYNEQTALLTDKIFTCTLSDNELSATSKPRTDDFNSQKRLDDQFVQDLANRVAPLVESKFRYSTSLVKESFKTVSDKQIRNTKSFVQRLCCYFFRFIFLVILMFLAFLVYASIYQRIYLNDRNIRVVPWSSTTWNELYHFLEYYNIVTIRRVNPPM